MQSIIQKLLAKSSCLLLFLLVLSAYDAKGQSRFPSILLGTNGLQELISAPQFPNSEYVAIQFCGLRRKCGFTQYYVEQIRNQGVNIEFFAVLDYLQEDMNPTLDDFTHQVVTSWGVHPSSEIADQVYILNQDRKVIYQGTLTKLDASLFRLLSKGEIQHQAFNTNIKRLAEDPQVSKGIWLYGNKVYPLGLTLENLVAANHGATKVVYANNSEKLILPVINFKNQAVINGFLTKLGKSLTKVNENNYSLKIKNRELTGNPTNNQNIPDWSKLLLNLKASDGVFIENMEEIRKNLTPSSGQSIKVNQSPTEILEEMQSIGIQFEITNVEAVKLLKIK